MRINPHIRGMYHRARRLWWSARDTGASLGRQAAFRTPPVERLKITSTICFLCTGNICRSPYAEHRLMQFLQDENLGTLRICSAGLDTSDGLLANATAQEASLARGLDLTVHRTTKFADAIVDPTVLVFAFDRHHLRMLKERFPAMSRRVFLLGAYGARLGLPHSIDDPYGMPLEKFQHCYDRIDASLKLFVEDLKHAQARNTESPGRR